MNTWQARDSGAGALNTRQTESGNIKIIILLRMRWERERERLVWEVHHTSLHQPVHQAGGEWFSQISKYLLAGLFKFPPNPDQILDIVSCEDKNFSNLASFQYFDCFFPPSLWPGGFPGHRSSDFYLKQTSTPSVLDNCCISGRKVRLPLFNAGISTSVFVFRLSL